MVCLIIWVLRIVQTTCCSLRGLLWYWVAVVLFDHGHHCFWNFNFIPHNNVVRVKSYVNSLFNPMGTGVMVNKLDLVPEWTVSGLISNCSETSEVWVWASRIHVSLSYSLIHSITKCLHRALEPVTLGWMELLNFRICQDQQLNSLVPTVISL